MGSKKEFYISWNCKYIKYTAGQRCPSYQLPFLWNNLPTNIKQISNSLKFKATLKNYLLSSWLVVWLWHQWLMTLTVDCWLSWGQHAISQATVHFGSIIINRSNFFLSILFFFIVLFLLEPSTLLLFIVTDNWWK